MLSVTRFSMFTDEELDAMESAFCNEGLTYLIDGVANDITDLKKNVELLRMCINDEQNTKSTLKTVLSLIVTMLKTLQQKVDNLETRIEAM